MAHTKPAFRHTTRVAGAVVLVAALVLAGSGNARADDLPPDSGDQMRSNHRVLDRSNELMPRPALAAGMQDDSGRPLAVPGVIPLPAGLSLALGETVQVNYADGVAVHTALAAKCTQSATAETPRLSTVNSVLANHTFSLSSGCLQKARPEGRLTRVGLLGFWFAEDLRVVTVNPGATYYWTTSRACANKNATEWLSVTAGEEAGAAIATSPKKSFKCGR